MEKPVIYLYTDGAASGNPGPGGYGAILRCAGHEKELSGGFARTTNNRMELMAVIVSYVVKAVNEGWLDNWQRKGWKKVKNPDLWMRFLEVYRRHRVTFHWIRGHAGHPENERCDTLAVNAGGKAAAAGAVLPEDTGYISADGEGDVIPFD